MTAGLLEIAQDKRHLSLYRGFIKISEQGEEIGRVPLATTQALLLTGHGISLSKNLLARLADETIVTIICGRHFQPVSMCLPVTGHHQSTGTLWQQIETSEPLKKRLWQSMVRAKISNQAAVLTVMAQNEDGVYSGIAKQLQHLASQTRSGDGENKEAQAARLYWPALFGKAFRRRRAEGGLNALLNYAYAILRSSIARNLAGAGLHPALGIHHKNKLNPFCLADDIIEPFRPFADWLVADSYFEHGGELDELTPKIKRHLASLLLLDVEGPRGITPINTAVQTTVLSLRESLETKTNRLWLPKLKPPQIDKECDHVKRSENLGERV